jgi:hypothetical protein
MVQIRANLVTKMQRGVLQILAKRRRIKPSSPSATARTSAREWTRARSKFASRPRSTQGFLWPYRCMCVLPLVSLGSRDLQWNGLAVVITQAENEREKVPIFGPAPAPRLRRAAEAGRRNAPFRCPNSLKNCLLQQGKRFAKAWRNAPLRQGWRNGPNFVTQA